MLYVRVNPVVYRNFTPDLHVLHLQPRLQPIIYLWAKGAILEKVIWHVRFVYFNQQESTVVQDTSIQFVASDGNEYSVDNKEGPAT